MTGGTFAKAEAPGPLQVAGGAAPIAVPSGLQVTLQDVIWNETGPQGLTMRFRFVAPAISRDATDLDYDVLQADMQALCETFALPRVSSQGPQPAQIIISLANQPLPFGETAPEVTQFFEAYSIQNGTCQWEIY